LRTYLQIGEHALDSLGPGIATVAQVKDKPRIPKDFSSKSGWGRVIAAQEFFHLSEQIHLSFSL
jgi:hypothetical protein